MDSGSSSGSSSGCGGQGAGTGVMQGEVAALLRLPYVPEQFGAYLGPTLTASGDVWFSWSELVRAAITVGRRNWNDVMKFGTYSLLEALWRLAMVRANLVEQADGSLRSSQSFEALEQSEKGSTSFFLGLVFTKLLADKLFGVPWLLHLDTYKRELAPALAFPRRPDFVGMDAARKWIVAESKGRSWAMSAGVMAEGKLQTRSLRSIGGALPAMRVVVGTYFAPASLRARLRDPEGSEPDSFDLDLGSESLARAYYRPLVEIVRDSGIQATPRPSEHGREIAVPLAGFDATLAIDERIFDWYTGGAPTWDEILAARHPEVSILAEASNAPSVGDSVDKDPENRRRFEAFALGRRSESQRTGDDGVSVDLGISWSEDFMRREPHVRSL